MKSEKRLEKGYREIGDDSEREREAAEWCEALIGDSSETGDFASLGMTRGMRRALRRKADLV
jgi:hypothetical protein